MNSRRQVLSPDEARTMIPAQRRKVEDTKRRIAQILADTPAYAFEAEFGNAVWQQLPGARGQWGRVPSDVRAGEVSHAWRQLDHLRGELWRQQSALEYAEQMAAAYTPAHAAYDELSARAEALFARVEDWLLPALIAAGGPPTQAHIDSYVLAASEAQDLATVLLQLTGADGRDQWGARSETAPAHRLGMTVHKSIIEKFPQRPRGPWGWEHKVAQARGTTPAKPAGPTVPVEAAR